VPYFRTGGAYGRGMRSAFANSVMRGERRRDSRPPLRGGMFEIEEDEEEISVQLALSI